MLISKLFCRAFVRLANSILAYLWPPNANKSADGLLRFDGDLRSYYLAPITLNRTWLVTFPEVKVLPGRSPLEGDELWAVVLVFPTEVDDAAGRRVVQVLHAGEADVETSARCETLERRTWDCLFESNIRSATGWSCKGSSVMKEVCSSKQGNL